MFVSFFFNDTATTEIYTLSLHDALPISHIVRIPEIREEEKEKLKKKLEGIRERILNGEDFGTLAYMYSKDPMSAKKNGELGFVQRGALVPEFEAVAFNLKEDEVSEIIETSFGYHILQLVERRGEKVNVRHILLTPEVSSDDLSKASDFLDSIASLIENGSLTFAEAAEKFSDDEDSKDNGGLVVNVQTGKTAFESSQLDPVLSFTIDKMEIGEISKPSLMVTDNGRQAYRLIRLIRRTDPHIANLRDDYQRIQNAALAEKQNNATDKWIKKKLKDTYVKIDDEYRNCKFTNGWSTL